VTATPQEAWRQNLPARLRPAPPELLLVSALMASAGGFLLIVVLPTVPDFFRLLGAGGLALDFGLLIAIPLIVLGAIAVAFLLLAWRIAHADRVARGLSYVLLGSFAAAILISNDHAGWLILTLLASIGAIAILAWSPNVRRYFLEHGKDAAQPTPVVIARTLIAWWASALLLVGVILLPLGRLGGKFAAAGLLEIGVAITAFIVNRRLAAADVVARKVITSLPVVVLIADVVLSSRSIAQVGTLAIAVGIVMFLWLPATSKEFFTPTAHVQVPGAPHLDRGAAAVGTPAPAAPAATVAAAHASPLSPASFCSACGEGIQTGWAHCSSCGAVVVPSVATARVTPPPGFATTWTLVLDTGDALEVSGLVLIGRDPSPQPDEVAGHLVLITDDGLSVSRTHMACALDADRFWVQDRASTNGVAIQYDSGKRQPCEPGAWVHVQGPAKIYYGDRWFVAPIKSAPDLVAASDTLSDDLERTQRRPRMGA